MTNEELASVIQKRKDGTFTKVLKFEAPDGEIVKLEIIYKPATAFKIAQIYDGVQDPDVDEQFDLMADLFNATITNIHFVNEPEGSADYLADELSVQDLTIDQRMELEAAVAPGVGNNFQRVAAKSKANRRKHGKGLRKNAK